MSQWSYGAGHALWTDASVGGLGHRPPRGAHDEACCGEAITERRAAVRSGDWLRLTQVHGDAVVSISDPARVPVRDHEADASVTDAFGVTLAIATADCAPIALSSDEGVVGAVHAGWKGLKAGVLAQAVDAMAALGATNITAALGPCIHSECYEFGKAELDEFAELWGEGVRAHTSNGNDSFDLPYAVAVACEQAGVRLDYVDPACTACSANYFSYRARQDDQRQVMLVWTEK